MFTITNAVHYNAPRLIFTSSHTGRYYRPLLSLSLPIELLCHSCKEHIAAAVEGGFDGGLDDTEDESFFRNPQEKSSDFSNIKQNICICHLFFVILQAKWNDLWIRIDSGNRFTGCRER
ncbi:MAG: hypothetical protein IJQ20_07510 [Paludibacteraceae bacterium]|nr:hypothetical protein [Paludibacteraceae bacterium]